MMRRFLSLLLVCAALLLLLATRRPMVCPARAAGGAQPTPSPQTQPAPPDRAQLLPALDAALSQAGEASLSYLIYDVAIHEISYDLKDGWAVVLLEFRDPRSGAVAPTEPGLGLARWEGNRWTLTLPGDPAWARRLPLVPDSLLDAAQKADWLARSDAARAGVAALGPFGGYLLPWEGGVTNRLTRSVAHGGREYYAFDFADYTPGNMFPVYAAKGGTVKYVKWTYPNGYYDGNCNHANYIVLEDTTTSPTTYQLYLHLAQDSIPVELRTHGVYVQQGQYLGMADDTGCSTGNHLHFQVHASPSWWDTAVDITFDDVPINGGRPRTPSEAASVGGEGQIYYTSGNTVHNPDTVPPQGGILTPFTDGALVTTRILALEGWATDDLSGIASIQFIANYSGTWHAIGPDLAPSLVFSYTWDLCAAPVPDGPVDLALALRDNANNPSLPLTGLRHILKQYTCAPPPPPACLPSETQAALFAEPGYQGACVLLNVGDYAQSAALTPLGGGNAASLLLGAQARVTLYGQEHFGGRSATFWASDPNLADDPIGADAARSARVRLRTEAAAPPQGQWPSAGAVFPPQASLDLLWLDGGGGNAFQVRLSSSPTRALTSTWQAALSLPLGSLAGGVYTWTVRARNPFTGGISVTQWSAPYTFSVQAGAPLTLPAATLPYTADMESAANWLASGWQLSAAAAHNGTAWVVSPTLVSPSQPFAADLTSPPISVTLPGYALRFWYRANTEGNGIHWDQRWVQISVDGAPFQNVLQLADDPMLGWMHSPEIALSPYLSRTIRVRFHFVTLDGVDNPAIPWAVDDLTIAPAGAYACAESSPNDTPASAVPLAFGQTVSGSICPPGDLDFYTFQGQAGQRISVDVDGIGAGNGSQLDGYLFLLADDGASQLAESDDEVLFKMQDPHLGYTLPYSGTYYLKLRAWDHPTAGGPAYTYTLRLMEDTTPPAATLNAPVLLAPNQTITLTASASDNDAVRQVAFWWHSGDWEQSGWKLLGVDADGRDGWQMPFDPAGLPPQLEMAFYAEAVDWAGNRAYTGVWNVAYGRAAYLPAIMR